MGVLAFFSGAAAGKEPASWVGGSSGVGCAWATWADPRSIANATGHIQRSHVTTGVARVGFEGAVTRVSPIECFMGSLCTATRLSETLNKALAARISLLRAVCSVANARNTFGYCCALRLAPHPEPMHAYLRGLIQHFFSKRIYLLDLVKTPASER